MKEITDDQIEENFETASWRTSPVPREEADNNILEIYNIIKANRRNFVMSAWHTLIVTDKKDRTCGTAHCLAGWADALHNQKEFKLSLDHNIELLKDFSEEYLDSKIHGFKNSCCTEYQDDMIGFMGTDDVQDEGWKYIWPVGHLFFETEKDSEEKVINVIENYLRRIGKIQ